MKKVILGLLASCTLVLSASAMADPFPDGLFQAGYLKSFGIVTCPPAISVIGTRVITDPGYDWTVMSRNFQNLMDASTEVPFIGAGIDHGVATCVYRMPPYGSMDAPSVVLRDDHHFLGLSGYSRTSSMYPTMCGPVAKDCVFVPKH